MLPKKLVSLGLCQGGYRRLLTGVRCHGHRCHLCVLETSYQISPSRSYSTTKDDMQPKYTRLKTQLELAIWTCFAFLNLQPSVKRESSLYPTTVAMLSAIIAINLSPLLLRYVCKIFSCDAWLTPTQSLSHTASGASCRLDKESDRLARHRTET